MNDVDYEKKIEIIDWVCDEFNDMQNHGDVKFISFGHFIHVEGLKKYKRQYFMIAAINDYFIDLISKPLERKYFFSELNGNVKIELSEEIQKLLIKKRHRLENPDFDNFGFYD